MWAPWWPTCARGLHAVLLIDYEWGAKLLEGGHERLGNDDASALRVLMFRDLSRLSAAEVSDWLEGLEAGPGVRGRRDGPEAQCGRAGAEQAIARIHEAIAAGETYSAFRRWRAGLWGAVPAAARPATGVLWRADHLARTVRFRRCGDDVLISSNSSCATTMACSRPGP